MSERSRRWWRATGWLAVLAIAAGCGGSRVERERSVQPVSPDTVFAWMASGREMRVFDVRTRDAYDREHLPGAMPAEDKTVSQLRAVLPYERHSPIVVYNQDGVVPETGHDLAAEAADAFRFPAVYWLEGGLEGWRAAGYNLDGGGAPD